MTKEKFDDDNMEEQFYQHFLEGLEENPGWYEFLFCTDITTIKTDPKFYYNASVEEIKNKNQTKKTNIKIHSGLSSRKRKPKKIELQKSENIVKSKPKKKVFSLI